MSREDEIKARLEKATKGPWEIRYGGMQGDTGYCITSKTVPAGIICEHWPVSELDARLANGHFIAHAREDVPYLLDELERARKEFSRMQTQLHVSEMALTLAGNDARLQEKLKEEALTENARLRRENERLAQANASALADSERIDALERDARVFSPPGSDNELNGVVVSWYPSKGQTLREAIDERRAQ